MQTKHLYSLVQPRAWEHALSLATIIVSSLLAALLAFTAARKLSHRHEVVETYARVGVPEARLNALAVVLIAGAGGLVAGLFWAPIGVAAATGLAIYFVLAIIAHIRAGDTEHSPTPIVMELLSVAALALLLREL